MTEQDQVRTISDTDVEKPASTGARMRRLVVIGCAVFWVVVAVVVFSLW